MADGEHNDMDPGSGFFDDEFAALQAIQDFNNAYGSDVNMATAPNVSGDVNMLDSPSTAFGPLLNQPAADANQPAADANQLVAGEFDGINIDDLLCGPLYIPDDMAALDPALAPVVPDLYGTQFGLYANQPGQDPVAAPHYPPPVQPLTQLNQQTQFNQPIDFSQLMPFNPLMQFNPPPPLDQPSPFDRQFVQPQNIPPQFLQSSQPPPQLTFPQPQLTLPQPQLTLPQPQLTLPQPIQPPQPNPPQPNLPRPATPEPANPQPANPQPAGPRQRRSPLAAARIVSKRSRKGAAAANDPNNIYDKPTGLAPWGPLIRAGRPDRLFQYYMGSAELVPTLTMTRNQLTNFFQGIGQPNPGRSLTLWIQNTAAQVNDRYAAGAASAKCRYEGCVVNQRTILKGLYRVAFDELSDKTGVEFDPMHNAGYMHLHCFEKIFDLGYLIHHGAVKAGLAISADTRHFAHENRNPASLTRDHASMAEAYNEWVQGQEARANEIEQRNAGLPLLQRYSGFVPTPDMILPHEGRLGCALTEHHLSLQNKGRQDLRDKRGGLNIGVHKGDLDLLAQLKRDRKQGGGKEPSPSADSDNSNPNGEGGAYQGRLRSHTPGPQPNPRKRGADDGGDEQTAPKRARRAATPPDVVMEDADDGQPQPQQAAAAAQAAVPIQSLLNAPPLFPAAQPQQAFYPQLNAFFQQTQQQAIQPIQQQPQQVQQQQQQQQQQQAFFPQPQQQAIQPQQVQPPPQPPQPQPPAAVPHNWQNQILPATGPMHDDELAARIGVMSKTERREVVGEVAKIEKRGGVRRLMHSFKACVISDEW